tara:strand:+ start:4425 stop:4883 length:459 start_codon:yes stop_codon:yes gene_type:complete
MPDFEEQLAIGLAEESRFLRLLNKHYKHAVKIEGSFKRFDFYVPELDMKVELKTDKKSNHTGNFVIETYHYGKPSGITTTTADFWVFNDGRYYYWISPEIIKDMILTSGIDQKRFIGNGDTVEKRAYLMSKSWIEKKSAFKWEVEAHEVQSV